jgi:alginate O-acetyltransferase complex protein AlgI
LFQAITYCALFLICVTVCATVRSRGVRQTVLLIASYVLYLTWGRWFIAVLLASTVINFLIGKWLRRNPSPGPLTIGIVFNVVLLASFKDLPEVAVQLPFSSLQGFAHVLLPLGMSFWTFQALSYLFDLYRGDELDPTLPEFALYMAFFPVTISGPICRMPEMLTQFQSDRTTAWADIREGFRRIMIGIFMMQVAKLLGQGLMGGDGIDSGFNRLSQWSGADVWCLAFGYGLQLFFDFAGYSHIAVGAAKALGFEIPENFARPFQSTSTSIFWTRWHMSLSFWIRDYIFLPLATARREIWWRNLSLVISMTLFGVWHRASVLFVVWGAYHGILLVLHRVVQQIERKTDREPPGLIWTPLSWAVTITLISFGWIFFRANTFAQARQMCAALSSPLSYSSHFLSGNLYFLVFGVAAAYAITLIVIDRLGTRSEKPSSDQGMAAAFARWRWYWLPPLFILALVLLLIATLTQSASTAQFMYNKF